MNNNIGIVIVSHSAKVAESVALMSHEMSSGSINISHCGGNPQGGLGSHVDDIIEAIKQAWSEEGVAIFVDLGSTEMNSKLAISSFSDDKAEKIVIMNAPLVEGVITSTAIAADGESLAELQQIFKNMRL